MNMSVRAGGLVLVLALGTVLQAAHAQRSILREFEQAFVDLSEAVRPSVVEISAKGKLSSQDQRRLNDWFKNFGLPGPDGEETPGMPHPLPTPSATASGFIYDAQGHIVTNNHVVRNAEQLTVKLWNGEEREAEVVGQDPDADLAVIKIDPTGLDLRPVRLGDSKVLKVGQFAIAMGSPSGLTGSFSYGHVTGLGRDLPRELDEELRFQKFIQTDAAINLGNSGGPLCNIDGEVIGVNVAIVYRANSIGFAIPIDRVKEVVPQLIARGKMIRGWLGVSILDLEDAASEARQELEDFLDAFNLPDKHGTAVQQLTPDGPAEQAGLQQDDVIREINGGRIESSSDLINTVSDMEPGTVATVGVWRKGGTLELEVTIGEFPGMDLATYGRDYLGMYVTKMDPRVRKRLNFEGEPSDFFVDKIIEGSPAQEAGIKRYDAILEIAHKDATKLENLKRVLREDAQPGKTLLVRVLGIDKEEPRKVYLKVPEDFAFE